jgi:hypothetical protein
MKQAILIVAGCLLNIQVGLSALPDVTAHDYQLRIVTDQPEALYSCRTARRMVQASWMLVMEP